MAHYSIYIPGVQGANNDHLTRVGLGDLLKEGGPEWSDVLQNGPDGGRGMVCTWRRAVDSDPMLGVHLDRQQWSKSPANPAPGFELEAGAYWIGHEVDRPPTPHDLSYADHHLGSSVVLNDGNSWIIPNALRMPRVCGLSEQGKFAQTYAPEFHDFCVKAEGYASLLLRAAGAIHALRMRFPDKDPDKLQVDFTLEESWEYAVECLSLNYRINAQIASYLSLLTERNIVSIVSWSVSLPDILHVSDQKKTEEDVVSIGVG